MSVGFPAPAAAVIPSNGIIDAGTNHGCFHRILPASFRWTIAKATSSPGTSRCSGSCRRKHTFEAAYVGNHTVRAPVAYNINASFLFNSGAAGRPLVPTVRQERGRQLLAGMSNNYNSMQMKVDRRFSGGLMITTAYTFSKALGYSPEDGGLWNYIQQQRSYSRLDFDRTHNFIAGPLRAALRQEQEVPAERPRTVDSGRLADQRRVQPDERTADDLRHNRECEYTRLQHYPGPDRAGHDPARCGRAGRFRPVV